MMKNMIKKLLLFVVFVFSAFISMAQQDAMFSHYMFNTQAVNPGYVGSRQVLSVMSVYRTPVSYTHLTLPTNREV